MKSQGGFRATSDFLESYRGKTGKGSVFPSHSYPE